MWRPLSFPSPDKLKIFSRIFFTPRLCKNISQLRSAKGISVFYTFSYSGCSAVELLISRKGWKGKIKKMKLEEKTCLVDYSAKGSSINSDADHHSDILRKELKMSQKSLIINVWKRIAPGWAPLCTPGLRPRGRSTQQYGLAQCLRRGYLSASGLCNQQRSKYLETLTSSRSDASSRRGRVTGPSYSSNSSETILSPGKAFLMPLYITLCCRKCVIVGGMDITCGRACHRRLQGRWLPPMFVPYFAPPCQPGSWRSGLFFIAWYRFIETKEQRWNDEKGKWERNDKWQTPDSNNLFPPKNSHLDRRIHHFPYAHLRTKTKMIV